MEQGRATGPRNPATYAAQDRSQPKTPYAASERLESLQRVRRTPYTQAPAVQDVRVDHDRPHVAMAQQLLHRPDVGPRLEQMRGERMAQRVTGRPLRDPRTAHRLPHGTLNGRFVQMMAPLFPGAGITLRPQRRKHPLPRPLRRRACPPCARM